MCHAYYLEAYTARYAIKGAVWESAFKSFYPLGQLSWNLEASELTLPELTLLNVSSLPVLTVKLERHCRVSSRSSDYCRRSETVVSSQCLFLSEQRVDDASGQLIY